MSIKSRRDPSRHCPDVIRPGVVPTLSVPALQGPEEIWPGTLLRPYIPCTLSSKTISPYEQNFPGPIRGGNGGYFFEENKKQTRVSTGRIASGQTATRRPDPTRPDPTRPNCELCRPPDPTRPDRLDFGHLLTQHDLPCEMSETTWPDPRDGS